jgi:hypothetical protein
MKSQSSSNGWISTSRTATVLSPNTTGTTEALPMDWTRVKRKRCDDDECCDDPVNCQLRNRRTSSSALPLKRTISNKKERIHDGYAIFCLHDANPSWFQGYFLPSNTANPWGLLAVQEEIDNCLECESGGYRRLTLKLPNHLPRIMNNNDSATSTTRISGIDWTGGDMMRLSNDKVEMNTQRLLTGKEALPYVKKYFGSLLKRLQQECFDDKEDEDEKQEQHEESTTMLKWLPDIAIVMGPMSIVLPDNETDEEKAKKKRTTTNYSMI